MSDPRSQNAFSLSREEALTIHVAGEILGIRLRERVREALGGAYKIGVNTTGTEPLPRVVLLPEGQ